MVEASRVIEVLEALAPLHLADSWDNVGLLLSGTRQVTRVGCTVDLTAAVLDEMLDAQVDFVVSYHPPIFSGLKRLTEGTPQGRLLLKTIRAGVHVYSPHTALDAVVGGMNDWLVEAMGPVRGCSPIQPNARSPLAGYGRVATLVSPATLAEALTAIKAHLGLSALRVAAPPEMLSGERLLSEVAVCPGSGGGVFKGVRHVDLLLTGELGHHDVLARVAQGTAVVLTDHTNTERGYLPTLAEALREELGIEVGVSEIDADPLVVHV